MQGKNTLPDLNRQRVAVATMAVSGFSSAHPKYQNSKIRKGQVRMGEFLVSSCADCIEMEACDPVDL